MTTSEKLKRHHRQSRGLETEKKVLAVAERLLREGGYDAAQIGHLVKESGVSVGSFYHHFGSKEGIIAALVRTFCDEGQADLAALDFSEKTFDQSLSAIVLTGLKRFRENPGLYRALAARVGKEPNIWQPFRDLRADFETKAFEGLEAGLSERGVSNPKLSVQRMTQVILAVMTHTVVFGSGPMTLNGDNTDDEMVTLARSVLLQAVQRTES